ncbi:Acetyl-coenzyme A carboxyl transferase alpha chain [Labilithrix luteola]|uniref:Acetyl-coenzyme A carboxylase carboxyl transferase subunit alpha n=1 Tax=Labilithrix luteola TaxID=1391654 RepID=A0A0K1QB89_9BACT|nr:acetyl-CoA carboxylase carboxyltransferase subunit alpha [Labilithrix luteola]AKV02998.1 Acetyl-coenzyme A carboxyl transferase alpha chain [Labilithrix luteola]
MASHVLPFEKPVVDLVARVRELRALAENDKRFESELRRLEEKAGRLARELFADLSPWQKVQLCRHPNRPYTLDYINHLIEDFVEMHGDRRFGDDPAIVGGIGRYHGRSVVVVGHQKGRTTKEKAMRNFGQAQPEGNRKASRLYELADRFGMPILTFVDTAGAYPGIGAEERGQSEAIGACLAAMSRARVPIITTIIGEGGSGGALALGVGNRVHVLEYGTYSVISPEGCASILWKDGAKADEAAARLRITAPSFSNSRSSIAWSTSPPAVRIRTTRPLRALSTPPSAKRSRSCSRRRPTSSFAIATIASASSARSSPEAPSSASSAQNATRTRQERDNNVPHA